MADNNEAYTKATLDLMKISIAGVIELSRDHGLPPKEYKFLAEFLPAANKVFRQHALERGKEK